MKRLKGYSLIIGLFLAIYFPIVLFAQPYLMHRRAAFRAFIPTDISGCVLWLDGNDSGGRHYMTATGATITTGINDPFGNSNGVGNFSSNALTAPDSADWRLGGGTGDCTLEFWIRPTSYTHGMTLVTQRVDTNNYWSLWYDSTNGPTFLQKEGGATTISFSQGATTGWSVDTWYHVAFVRNGNDFDIYRDGTSIASTTDADDIADFAAVLSIASPGAYAGQWSNFRISTTARYTAGFTKPSAPFENDANTTLLLPMTGTNGSTVFIDESTPADTGNIYSCKDKSGNFNHVREATNTPTYQENEVNSLPVIRGDGTNDKLANAISQNQPCTILIIAKVTASLTDNPLFGDSNLWVGLDASEYANGFAGSDVNDSTDHSAAFKLFTYKINGASSVVYVNSSSVATGDTGAGNLAAMNLFYEGTNYTAADIAEIVVYDSALSDTNKTKVENYLNLKYSIY